MRNLLSVAVIAALWPSLALAKSVQPVLQQSYISPHPWSMIESKEKTPFDIMQDNLKTVAQFKALLKVKAAELKKHGEGSGIGAAGQGAIGAVGGVGAVGSNGGSGKSIIDLFNEITPEEAAAALQDDYNRQHPKSLSDLLKPHRQPNLMQTLELRVFAQTRHDEFTGFNLANAKVTPVSAPAKAVGTEEKPAAAPQPKTSSQGPIGRVGGLGKVGPNP